MAVTLSSQEVAALTGKTERTVRRWAESGKIPAERVLNKFNSPEYLFSLDALEPHLQQKYFDGLKLTPSPEVAQTLTKEAKPLDTYSIEEQEEIAFWLRLVKQWQGYRNKPGANKTEVDANFVQWCKLEYPERAISVDTLYRRWNAVRDNDLDGLIDKRGKWKKGKSSIPDPMWQAFLYFYLDERQHPLKKCYEYTKLEMQTSFPELVGDMPSYTTFYRRAQADIPEPLKVLGREGEKAFRDRCAPYIRRVYDDMRSNEWWIADNHTFDIITEGENGQPPAVPDSLLRRPVGHLYRVLCHQRPQQPVHSDRAAAWHPEIRHPGEHLCRQWPRVPNLRCGRPGPPQKEAEGRPGAV